jgi:hypothetical protein
MRRDFGGILLVSSPLIVIPPRRAPLIVIPRLVRGTYRGTVRAEVPRTSRGMTMGGVRGRAGG